MGDPVPMLRLTAVLLEADERTALQALARLGTVELVRLRAGPDTAPLDLGEGGGPPWAALLARIERLRSTLGGPSPEATLPRPGSPAELEALVEGAEQRVGELSDRRARADRRRDELAREAARLARWRGLGICAPRVGVGPWAVLRMGTVPAQRLEALIQSVGREACVLALPSTDARRPVLVLGWRGSGAAVDAALGGAGFEDERPPAGAGALDEIAAARAREAEQAAAEARQLEDELRATAGDLGPVLSGVELRARLEQRLEEARRSLPRTRTAVLLRGWTPATEAPAVDRCVRRAAGDRCVLAWARPGLEDEDEVPVLLRSSPLLRPFERLVAGFGLPRYRELSPAPFLAASFLVMFGVMFGDLGHGAVLMGAGAIGLAVRRWRRWRDPALLLVLCGAASAAAGLVYGSCFGLERFRLLALWRDPLEGDPLRFLVMGMALGVLTISLGMLLHVVDRLRHRDPLTALLDRFGVAGLAFYWAAIALLSCRALGADVPAAASAVLLLPVAAWLAGDRLHHGGAGRAPSARGPGWAAGLVESFETILVDLASTVSFMRLAAYGMSHAALLLAVLAAAQAVGRPGSLGFGAVLVVGNGLAIALEGVIAGVQALRLEYYEFFGKFFSGAGRPFLPFRLELTGGRS